jgi:peptidyl-prolyl cis-trans isomerase SurA
MFKILKTLFFSLFILPFSVNSLALNNNADYIAIKVNDHAITKSEIDNRFKLILLTSDISIKNQKDQEIVKNQIIDKIIDEQLIIDHAKDLGIEISNQEIEVAIEDIAISKSLKSKKFSNLKSSAIFKKYLKKEGIYIDNFSKQIKAEILWSKIVNYVIKPKVKISDVEIREFFEQQNISNDEVKYELGEIFISNNNKNSIKLAEKLLLELNNGADYEDIVRQFSNSVITDKNGKIGWVYSSQIDGKISAEIQNLQKNQYSKIVNLNDGFHIFKIFDREIKKNNFPEEDIEVAKKIISSKKLQVLSKGYLMNLRKKSFIEIKI